MFKREIINKQKVIITDGMPSSGKTLVCNLISSLPKGRSMGSESSCGSNNRFKQFRFISLKLLNTYF